MILVNTPRPEKLPEKTVIYLSNDHRDIIVKTSETDIKKLIKQVETFINTELEKAEKQLQIYTTIINTLKEAKG